MESLTLAPLWVAGLFVAMIVLFEVGRRAGLRRKQRDGEGVGTGLGAVEGAVFALMGLLIAFTFSGAAARFDDRRHLIVEEANAIGTAYLRLDLVPPAAPALKEKFRRYLDARLLAYRKLPDIAAAKDELAQATAIQGELWADAVVATREAPQARMLLIPALNSMFDIATTRAAATQIHPPPIIFLMLALLALACSLLAGHGMAASKTRSWMHMIGFALIMTMTIYVIVDLEYPRFGLIRVDSTDQLLIDVRASMGADEAR